MRPRIQADHYPECGDFQNITPLSVLDWVVNGVNYPMTDAAAGE
jgi:hypothetical protein